MQIFKGSANVYLQGLDALEPIQGESNVHMVYYIGSSKSRIKIEDFRKKSNQEARKALATFDDSSFADVFNLPANVEIYECDNFTNIRLNEGVASDEDPMLWVGVWNNDEIDKYSILWETMKLINNNNIAFALLIE